MCKVWKFLPVGIKFSLLELRSYKTIGIVHVHINWTRQWNVFGELHVGKGTKSLDVIIKFNKKKKGYGNVKHYLEHVHWHTDSMLTSEWVYYAVRNICSCINLHN